MKDGFLIGFLRPGQCQQVPSSRPIHQQSLPISGRVCVCVCVCVCGLPQALVSTECPDAGLLPELE